jgi:hypothetical protein
MSDTSKVTIVHICNYLQPNTLTNSKKIVNLVENNAVFLSQHDVEYIVLDNLRQQQEAFLLANISKIPSYQTKKFEYIKEKNTYNTKDIFLTGIRLATNQNIFFVFNEIEIDINNVFEIEKSAPFLQKQDLNFFQQNTPVNFHPKNFKLHMKKNKNILDKLKLLFV